MSPASDGQYKAQVYRELTGTELYIARAGRFNVEGYPGWNETNDLASAASDRWNRELTHHQVPNPDSGDWRAEGSCGLASARGSDPTRLEPDASV